MKLTLCCVAFIFLIGCGRPTETTAVEDSTRVADNQTAPENSDQLNRFLKEFEVGKESYPLVGFIQENERTTRRVDFFFENDDMVWMQSDESANEGGESENYVVNRDPEGMTLLHYATKGEGIFGYEGNDGGTWYAVGVNDDYEPYITGSGQKSQYEYTFESDFEETMKFVRENKDKFKLKDGYYTYQVQKDDTPVTYLFSEVLFESNLLSPTSFDAAMIKPYLDWWYPLYEDASGTLYRHRVCTGDEDYIKITVEAGNYRWEEETSGATLVYWIKGFEESEGDAFYATIEKDGNRLKKTLIITENENESDRLMIDGRVYTKTPSKYDIVTMKCD